MTFEPFFKTATRDPARPNGNAPYYYQCRLACGEMLDGESNEQWLAHGTDCASKLIEIPTGLGKTAAVVLAWLWNRIVVPSWEGSSARPASDWPRRLVYCLPMRTLVEQTRENVELWLKNLGLSEKVGLHILMGGEDSGEWDVHPEQDAILIGTQDMLLSRALNRGYGMSRYRWPMHFGLLNNDALWVMDETQLMGPGLATACQLEAFRLPESAAKGVARFGSFSRGTSVTWYVSATANRKHLVTRDWRGVTRPEAFHFGLTNAEIDEPTGRVAERLRATKILTVEEKRNFGSKEKAPAPEFVAEVCNQHDAMVTALAKAPASLLRRTLVICNTVDRAVRMHREIAKQMNGRADCDLMLMHSRFRPAEKEEQVGRLKREHLQRFSAGQIIVATQVIEAGVDLSSAVLWSEIAPLSSLVQRLGRVNRAGEFGFGSHATYDFAPQAIIVGIDSPRPGEINALPKAEQREKAAKEADQKHLPYDPGKCGAAWNTLMKLTDASPHTLRSIAPAVADSIEPCPYSLQRHELLDFFDTDANLSLGFTDVSPFVRGIDPETDFQVLWREWPGSEKGEPPPFWPDYQRRELCSVSIGKVREARGLLNRGWIWRGKGNDEDRGRASGWVSIASSGDIVPGMTILLPESAGGYDAKEGWTGKSDDKVSCCYVESHGPSDDDRLSYLCSGWRSIEEHTREVSDEAREILETISLASLETTSEVVEEAKRAFDLAIPWHDVGKLHRRWIASARFALRKAGISWHSKRQYRPLAKFSLSDSPQLKPDGLQLTGDDLKRKVRELRRLFRPRMAHEVASALAFRQHEQNRLRLGRDTDYSSLLAEYLIMSHHGHVRKVLRDEIPRFARRAKDADSVRGISTGDFLPSITIQGATLAGLKLSTDCRRMGRDANDHESYTRGVLRVLKHYGPFRLAYLEAIFRAADCRASEKASRPDAGSDSEPSSESSVIREDSAPYGDESPELSADERALVEQLVADGLEIQRKFRPEPLYKETGKGHYGGDTLEEIEKARTQSKRQDKQP